MKYIKSFNEARTQKIKVNFEWRGFKFKNIGLSVWGSSTYGNPTAASAGQVIKQYIKQKYNLNCQIGSDTYAGGDSLRVCLSPLDVNIKDYNIISNDIKYSFQDGTFNGMEDIYEYGENECSVEIDGKIYNFGAKFVFVEHRPKYGTKLYNDFEQWKKDTIENWTEENQIKYDAWVNKNVRKDGEGSHTRFFTLDTDYKNYLQTEDDVKIHYKLYNEDDNPSKLKK
jgi:hypothetical protein